MLLKHKLDPINPPAYNLSLDRWCFQNKTQALHPGHEALCDLAPATHCGLFFFCDSAEILLTPGHLHLLFPLPGKALSLELHQAGSFSFCGLSRNATSSERRCRPLRTLLSTKCIPTLFASSFLCLLVGWFSLPQVQGPCLDGLLGKFPKLTFVNWIKECVPSPLPSQKR